MLTTPAQYFLFNIGTYNRLSPEGVCYTMWSLGDMIATADAITIKMNVNPEITLGEKCVFIFFCPKKYFLFCANGTGYL